MNGDNYTNLTQATSSVSEDTSKMYNGILAVYVSLTCVIGFSVNAFTLVSFRWMQRPVPPAVIIILSLALADMIASLIVGATSHYNEFLVRFGFIKNVSDAGQIFERLNTLAYHSCSIILFAHVIILEINRWVQMIYPVEYGKLFGKRTVLAITALLWISTLSLIFGYFGICTDCGSFFYRGWESNYTHNKFMRDMTWRKVMAGLTLLPIILIAGIHIHLNFYFNRPASREMIQKKLLNGNSWPLSLKLQTMAVLGSYIFGWMSSNLIYVLICERYCFISPQQISIIYDYRHFQFLLAALNPIFNNVVYAWNDPSLQVREAILSLQWRLAVAVLFIRGVLITVEFFMPQN